MADRVLLIQDGRLAKEYTGQVFRNMTNKEANRLGLRSLRLKELVPEHSIAPVSDTVALDIENVTVGYNVRNPIIKNMNVKIRQGEILGIVGHNGVGKSTLLEAICGLKKEQAGRFLFCGKPLSPKQRIKETYLVMQDSDYQLFTESVENELYLENRNDPQIEARTAGLLKEMDLEQFRERHPASLSGGQKQRLSIAVAYMKNAGVICFDEPTSGLDFQNMLRVRKLFLKMAGEGKTLLVISHDYEFLLATCMRVLCIHDDYQTECFDISEQTRMHLAKAMETR